MTTTARVLGVLLAVFATVLVTVVPALAPLAQAQPREIKIGGTMAVTGGFAVE